MGVLPPPAAPWTASSPRCLVAYPPAGHIHDKASSPEKQGDQLEIFYAVLGDVDPAWEVRVDFEGGSQPPAYVSVTMVSVVLTKVEPATHVLGFTVG